MVYNYTKPRQPIAAMYPGPGPCYNLPSLVGYQEHDPRSVHTRGPAYQFGVHHSQHSNTVGPGPSGYFPDSKIYRDGPDGSPRYSLYGRRRDLTPFKTPGPGAYSTDKGESQTRGRPPSFSLGASLPTRKLDNSPAPNTYLPPPLLGKTVVSNKPQAPAYRIYGRSKTGGFDEDFAKTPGPGSYQAVSPNQYKHRQPVYSLKSRSVAPGDTTLKPGPGAHRPEQVTNHMKKQPSFSFGIRHSEYEAPLIVTGVDF